MDGHSCHSKLASHDKRSLLNIYLILRLSYQLRSTNVFSVSNHKRPYFTNSWDMEDALVCEFGRQLDKAYVICIKNST